MDCSTKGKQGGQIREEYRRSGIVYDARSVDEGLLKLTDIRRACGKIYRLDPIVMILVLAK